MIANYGRRVLWRCLASPSSLLHHKSCTEPGRASFLTGRVPIRSALSIVVAPLEVSDRRALAIVQDVARPKIARAAAVVT